MVVVLWARLGWRLVPRLGRRRLGVVNPLAQTPKRLLLKLLFSGGFGGRGWKAD
ncbi:MAG: hypothetical protein ACJ72N_00755 [Labedaea sp.]